MACATLERTPTPTLHPHPTHHQAIHEKNVTVLFADIKGFTQHLSIHGSHALFRQLNDYLVTMVGVVEAHGGTVLNQQGDGFMAVFGLPQNHQPLPKRDEQMTRQAKQACQAAVAMSSALRWLNDNWHDDGRPALQHGVGISTGPVMMGQFLADPTMGPTLIGQPVNLAARLQSQTRRVGQPILVCQSTVKALGPLDKSSLNLVGHHALKGFAAPQPVYALCELSSGHTGLSRSPGPSSSQRQDQGPQKWHRR
jgi:adenylate cyclase